METMDTKKIIEACREKEFHSFGTARIFEKRAGNLGNLRTIITFLGIITPVIVGGSVLAFGIKSTFLPYLIGAVGLLSLIQLTLSVWSIVARWDEKHSYAIESTKDNTKLYNMFKELADQPTANLSDSYSVTLNLYKDREKEDIVQNISQKEKNFANRESLKYYQKPCHICKQIPNTSKPSKCDACGNF